MQSNPDEDICFLPGWMYDPGYYGFAPKVRLWQTPLNKIQPVTAKILIGFSLGGHLALKWFLEGKAEKLILINPVIKPRSFTGLILCHLYYIFENFVKGQVNWSRTISFKYLPNALLSARKIFNFNFWQLIEKCPPEKVTLVFSAEDNFFTSKTDQAILQEKGFKVIEVPGNGHRWTASLRREVEKQLNLNYD